MLRRHSTTLGIFGTGSTLVRPCWLIGSALLWCDADATTGNGTNRRRALGNAVTLSWHEGVGRAAVRRLKNDPQTRKIPIIGMSTRAEESEREKAIATGCDEFDAKPIEFESLVATIRRVLAPHK
jgi:DNA-binding NarL/FixJ family response regulator